MKKIICLLVFCSLIISICFAESNVIDASEFNKGTLLWNLSKYSDSSNLSSSSVIDASEFNKGTLLWDLSKSSNNSNITNINNNNDDSLIDFPLNYLNLGEEYIIIDEEKVTKLFFNTEKDIYTKGNSSYIDLFNPLTNKVEKYKVSNNVEIKTLSNQDRNESKLVIASFDKSNDIVTLKYQLLSDSSIYGLDDLSAEYSNLKRMEFGYLQNGDKTIIKFLPFSKDIKIASDAKIIIPTVKYNKSKITKISYSITNKLPKSSYLVAYITNENEEAQWVICSNEYKMGKLGKNKKQVEPGELAKFAEKITNGDILEYTYNNQTHYMKKYGYTGILNEYQTFGGTLLLDQWNYKEPDIYHLDTIIRCRTKYGYDFIINGDTITFYYNVSGKTYYTTSSITYKDNSAHTALIDAKAVQDILGIIFNNEKKLNIKIYSELEGDYVSELYTKINSLKLKDEHFKTVINKKKYNDCEIVEDAIYISNDSSNIVLRPYDDESTNYLYEIELFNDLGIEVFENRDISDDTLKAITLKYLDKYVTLNVNSMEYDDEFNYFIDNSKLSNFYAYVMLNNKTVKFKK